MEDAGRKVYEEKPLKQTLYEEKTLKIQQPNTPKLILTRALKQKISQDSQIASHAIALNSPNLNDQINEELPFIYREKQGALLHQLQQFCQQKLGAYLSNLSLNLPLQI